jgi:hypothetical protein
LVITLGLVLMAVMVLVAVAVAASTRLGQLMTLLVCLCVFVLSSMHPFLFGRWADEILAARIAGWIVPNLTYLYPFGDVILENTITPTFAIYACGYALTCIGAALLIGMALLQTRELEARQASGSLPGAVGLLAGAGRFVAVAAGLIALTLLTLPAFHNLTGLLTAGGLLVSAPVGWMLWGSFSRGKNWAYWVVLLLAIGAAGTFGAGMFMPGVLKDALASKPVPVLLGEVAAASIVLILLLPKTRRHFVS